MRRGGRWAALALLLLGLGGVAEGREMEELRLIADLAADAGAGGVRLTAVTGVRASEGEAPQVLTGAGADMAAACRAVERAEASHAYLGQADRLLLGEALAREELMETLDFVLEHRELRLDTALYVVWGDAGQALAEAAPGMAGETPGRDERAVTVGQAMARLYAGEEVEVPALAPGEAGGLAPAGWARLGPQGLSGGREGAE